jgi:tetratricopeptide (TPR) repeat protein
MRANRCAHYHVRANHCAHYRMRANRCAHLATARTWLLLAAAAWVCTFQAIAAPAVAPAPSPDKVAATSAPGDLEVLSLLADGRKLSQCGLPDCAWPMYQAALKRTAEPQTAHLRLRAVCEAAISLFKSEQVGEGETLIAPLRNTLSRGDDPDARCLRDLALGYAALAANKVNEAADAQLEAVHEVQTKAIAVRQGDCHLLLAAIHLARKKYPEAADSGRAAVRSYTAAGLLLSVAEAQRFVARALTESNDPAAAKLAEAQALGTIASLTQGPYLDPSRTADQLAALVAGHRAAADEKHYDEARNGALSLLVLAHNRSRFAGRPEIAASEDLNEHVLLGYLALYARLSGAGAPAAEFLALAEKELDKETSPRAQGETEWLAARYERENGDLGQAMHRLDAADAALLNRPGVPGYLAVGVAEERALILAAQKDGPGAAKSLQAALAAAKAANLQPDQARLERYLAEVGKGNLSIGPGAVQPTVPVEATRKAERLALLTQAKVPVFRSPFVSDYPEGAAASAIEALSKIALARPTPPAATGNLISPEERIRLGSMLTPDGTRIVDPEQFRKAIPDLLQILAREGDSAKRLDQLGTCYSSIGKWPEAVDAYERILKLDPNNAPAHARLDDIRAHLLEKKTE